MSTMLAHLPAFLLFLDASPSIQQAVRWRQEVCVVQHPLPRYMEHPGGGFEYYGLRGERLDVNLDTDPAAEQIVIVYTRRCLMGTGLFVLAVDDDQHLLGTVEVAGQWGASFELTTLRDRARQELLLHTINNSPMGRYDETIVMGVHDGSWEQLSSALLNASLPE